jgi:hypothetical protein
VLRPAQTNVELVRQLADDASFGDDALARIDRSYELARVAHSAQFRPNGKPFVAHLVGTASIVAMHGGSVDAVCAALLHAVLVQGDFGTGLRRSTPHRRRAVRAAAGDVVEQIVSRYPQVLIGTAVPDDAVGRDAMLVRLANELEEAIDDGRSPAALAALAEWAVGLGDVELAERLRSSELAARPIRPKTSISVIVRPRSMRRRSVPWLVDQVRSRRRARGR